MRWILLVSAVTAACSWADDRTSPLIPSMVDGAKVRYALDDARYQALKTGPAHFTLRGFVLPTGLRVDMNLERFEVFAVGAQIVKGSEAGDIALPKPDVVTMRGTVVGKPESTVYLALSPTGCNGWVEMDGKLHMLSSGGPHNYPIEARDVASIPDYAPEPWRCETYVPRDGGCEEGVSAQVGNWPRVCSVAVETDYEFTGNLFGGNTAASTAYVATLFGAMNTIYKRDFKTDIVVRYVRVWDTPNDPWSAAGTGDELGAFQAYWNANMTGVKRTLAHFLSGRGLGGGVAWLTVLCNGSYGYGLSANLAGYFPPGLQPSHSNWDPFVVAHEMGHNFGNPHTHDYNPPLDRCGIDCAPPVAGTIMSYCHTCSGGMRNIWLMFHSQQKQETDDRLAGGFYNCVSTTQLQLNLDLQEYAGGKVAAGTVQFYDPATLELRLEKAISWTGQTLTVNGVPTGSNLVRVKVGNWLAKAENAVLLPPVTEPLTISLLNGDAQVNNAVDLFDVSSVLVEYGSYGIKQGDITCDWAVNLSDLNLTLVNFGLQGD